MEVLVRTMTFCFVCDSDYFFKDLWFEIFTVLQGFLGNKAL